MIKTEKGIYFITATRFNNDTWLQNKRYRENHNFSGCIYGVPKLMPESVQKEAKLYVFEMNNSKPCKIMGIGILYNKIKCDKTYNIYDDKNYNRYTYIGKQRIDRNELNEESLEELEKIENIVFKGKDHIKRGQGISCFPQKKLKLNENILIHFINNIDKNM
jgi:hypothetical protein